MFFKTKEKPKYKLFRLTINNKNGLTEKNILTYENIKDVLCIIPFLIKGKDVNSVTVEEL